MRTFWIAVSLLVLATVGVFTARAWSNASASRAQAQRAAADARRVEAAAHQEALKAAAAAESRRLSAQRAAEAGAAATPTGAAPSESTSSAPTSPVPTPDVATTPASAPPPAAGAPKVHNPKPAAIVPAAADDKAPAKPVDQGPLIPPTLAPAKVGDYDVMGATLIDRDENGAIVVDGKFTIKGAGTREDPYIVPWDLLVSVQDDFDPSRKALRIPERVALLDGKYVRLDGYVSFPLMTNEPKELLAMLNQWDGCCIGVPPTPYDAVEVRLKRAITGDDRFSVSGRVVGKFSVKPYVVKSWLVGMYVMDEGEFKPSENGDGT